VLDDVDGIMMGIGRFEVLRLKVLLAIVFLKHFSQIDGLAIHEDYLAFYL
jgi:hypothetical protein